MLILLPVIDLQQIEGHEHPVLIHILKAEVVLQLPIAAEIPSGDLRIVSEAVLIIEHTLLGGSRRWPDGCPHIGHSLTVALENIEPR